MRISFKEGIEIRPCVHGLGFNQWAQCEDVVGTQSAVGSDFVSVGICRMKAWDMRK